MLISPPAVYATDKTFEYPQIEAVSVPKLFFQFFSTQSFHSNYICIPLQSTQCVCVWNFSFCQTECVNKVAASLNL